MSDLSLAKIFLDFVRTFNVFEIVKKREYDGIGVELYRLYTEFNNIYINGLHISEILEEYASSDPSRKQLFDIKRELKAQCIALDQVQESLRVLSDEFQVIDASSYRSLMGLFRRPNDKSDGLGKLLYNLEKGFLSISSQSIESLGTMEEMIRLRESYASHSYSSYNDDPSDPLNKYMASVRRVHGQLNSEDSNRLYIAKYLESAKPREQLDEIQSTLVTWQKALEDNFSVKDIIIKIGDKTAVDSRTRALLPW